MSCAPGLEQVPLPGLLCGFGWPQEQQPSATVMLLEMWQELLWNQPQTTSEPLCARCKHPLSWLRSCMFHLCIVRSNLVALVL